MSLDGVPLWCEVFFFFKLTNFFYSLQITIRRILNSIKKKLYLLYWNIEKRILLNKMKYL